MSTDTLNPEVPMPSTPTLDPRAERWLDLANLLTRAAAECTNAWPMTADGIERESRVQEQQRRLDAQQAAITPLLNDVHNLLTLFTDELGVIADAKHGVIGWHEFKRRAQRVLERAQDITARYPELFNPNTEVVDVAS